MKIGRSEVSAILVSIEAWKKTEQWQREGGRYIPYPATFLNDRRWEDGSMASQVSRTEERGKYEDLPAY